MSSELLKIISIEYIVGILAVIALLIYVYNLIVKAHNAAIRAWADVIAIERQKTLVINQMSEIVGSYGIHEARVNSDVIALRSNYDLLSTNTPDSAALREYERVARGATQGFGIIMESYPNLKADKIYMRYMNELTMQQNNTAAAIRIFNYNTEDFNNTIGVFPNSLINLILARKKKIEPFSDIESENAFSYRPNF